MRKIIVLCFLFVLFAVPQVYGAEKVFCPDKNMQSIINQTGFKILNSNAIEHRMIFNLKDTNEIYGQADLKQKRIYVSTNLFSCADSQDELAAVITRQIVRCVLSYEESNLKYSEKTAFEKYEAYVDKRTVDYLVNAGYSPLALITFINKYSSVPEKGIFPKQSNPSVRMARIFEYITRKYPQTLEDKKYKNNIYYQNFLLNSRYNRGLIQNKMKHNPYSLEKLEYR